MEYGININGDRPLGMIKRGALAAEDAGFHTIWVGEKPKFIHPFTVAAVLAKTTLNVRIGSGIISPLLNRCRHVVGGYTVLREAYGDRFIVGLAPGDRWGLREVGVPAKKAVERVEECLKALKQRGFRVYIGASDPDLARLGGTVADGLLINYVKPEYVKWALEKAGDKVSKAAYGPSLLLPDHHHHELLLVGAATVAAGTSMSFQREFGLEEWVRELRDILRRRAYGELRAHRKRLLESFTIHGGIEDVLERVAELRKLGIDEVIFGGPLSHNIRSVAEIGNRLREL
jgi:alkanesulfonate monooxygenase SsuD/methylene tetrahydromethanopterin reductase-like flavin-dependent oxidoreductase (luciferase family)